MFNLFNKKKEENPIGNVLENLTLNQKMSVANLLLSIGVCDREQGNERKEIEYLNSYVKILDVRSDKCLPYLELYGQERIVQDLKVLTKSQKELLVIASWEMIICDAKPNETELQFTVGIFDKIGINEDEFIAIIEKTQALMKHFYGK